MSNPWLKFYPTDWRADARLKLCSLAARGLWIELIALMHEAEPYGHLRVAGHAPTETQIAALTGAAVDEITVLLNELETAGVFSRTKNGVIYSRRMVRDHRKAETARKNGRGGGNPSLRNISRNPASDNPSDKGKDKPQKPEARSQIYTSPNGDDGRAVGLAKSIFDLGLQYLGANGLAEDKARRLLGRWRKDYGDHRVLAALGDAQTAGATDPAAYVTAILSNPPQSGAEIDLDAVFAGINADGSIQ